MGRFWVAVFVIAMGMPAVATAQTAQLEVVVQEANPIDWILIRNAEGCGPVTGEVRVDFRGSVGQVVIDTAPGGLGSNQFAPVEVLVGPVRPMPISDGGQVLSILIVGLEPGDQALLTMDLDSEADLEWQDRVVATAAETVGSIAVFTGEGDGAAIKADFGPDAIARLEVPVDCAALELS